jgi:sugar lactone lactonase YvrE
MAVFTAEPFYLPPSDALRFLPECPRVLRSRPDTLAWVAIQESATSVVGSVNLLNLRTLENDSHPLPGRPGFFAETDREDMLVVGMERSLVLYDLRRRAIVSEPFVVTEDERVVINDGLAVHGGLLFGTKHTTFKERIACMYFLDSAQGRLHTLHAAQICANGKFLHNGGLVDIDSFNKTLDYYPVEMRAPRLGERRIVADFRDTPLFPDGLRPGPELDSVLVAFYNPEPAPAGVAREFGIADGAVRNEWTLPGSPRVTCPDILRLDGRVRVLFTTAVEGMDPVTPNAGAMYIADTPFTDVPQAPPLFAAGVFD